MNGIKTNMCVNALNGLFPFLHFMEEHGGELIVCQRPKRAFSISTDRFIFSRSIFMCVNALNGLFPFLLKRLTLPQYIKVMGVNALNGLFPFLLDYGKVGSNWI